MLTRWKLMGPIWSLVVGSLVPVAASAAAPAGYDATAPTLLAISVPAQLDVQSAANQLVVDLDISDNAVGLRNVTVSWTGPQLPTGGQSSAEASLWLVAPQSRWHGRVVWTPHQSVVPGLWRVTGVHMVDLNGNSRDLSQEVIANLGASSTMLVNRKYDSRAPQLVAGQIMTPTYSASARLPGSSWGQRPFVKVEVTLRDSADKNQMASGVSRVEMVLCKEGVAAYDCAYWWYGNSMTLRGEMQPRRTGSVSLSVSGTPEGYVSSGDVFQIYSITIRDKAGNQTYLQSNRFGGTTDFGAFFPSTTMTVTP